MITKTQLLDLMQHQTNVIKHLATKVPEGQLDWRPTEGQRSTTELLRYMTVCALLPAQNLITGNWDHVPAMNAEAEAVTPETFADAMDRQMARLGEILDGVDDGAATTTERGTPWGAPIMQGAGFVDLPYAALVSYRMQLFLYAKESGNSELSSANCWIGCDKEDMAPPS